jgi:hypothetical protein
MNGRGRGIRNVVRAGEKMYEDLEQGDGHGRTILPRPSLWSRLGCFGTRIGGMNSMWLSAGSAVWSGVHLNVVVSPTLYAECKKTGVRFRTADMERADDISLRSLRTAANDEESYDPPLKCALPTSYESPLPGLTFHHRTVKWTSLITEI